MALLLPAFIWPRVSPLFHVMMLCFREGCSRMLGTGFGRTTLYMRGVRDGVVDVFAGSGVPGPLEVSDTAAGVWSPSPSWPPYQGFERDWGGQ